MNTVFIHPTEKIAAVGGRQSAEKDVYPHRIFRTSIRHKAHLRDFFRFVCQPVKLCPHCNVTAFYITERTYSFSAFWAANVAAFPLYTIFSRVDVQTSSKQSSTAVLSYSPHGSETGIPRFSKAGRRFVRAKLNGQRKIAVRGKQLHKFLQAERTARSG